MRFLTSIFLPFSSLYQALSPSNVSYWVNDEKQSKREQLFLGISKSKIKKLSGRCE